jgi:NCAIR mutase (PurE)-related protein
MGSAMTDDIRMDWERGNRIGLDEAVFCDGKSNGQIARILDLAAAAGRRLLLTRLGAEQQAALTHQLDYDEISGTAFFGAPAAAPGAAGVAIVSAGSSDAPRAAEARRTLEFQGYAADGFADVGVAGLWRVLEIADDLAGYRVVIVAAGMEGALFSVVAGLTPGAVIALPTSVGYGVAAGGRAALSSALASCAPGVVAVNIDNGYGAACAAMRILGWQQ